MCGALGAAVGLLVTCEIVPRRMEQPWSTDA
jgi:hypothetical protein